MRRATFIVLTFFLASFSGCFGEDVEEKSVTPALEVEDVSSAIRGQYMSIAVESTVDWTVNRSPGLFFCVYDKPGCLQTSSRFVQSRIKKRNVPCTKNIRNFAMFGFLAVFGPRDP